MMKRPKITLMHVILFPMCFVTLFLIGQQNSWSRDSSSHDLEECKRTIEHMKSILGAKNSSLNMCAFALSQPHFSPVIDDEGAIIVFDEKGIPIYGQTTRLIDYSTRGVYPARSLTKNELNNCKEKLVSYHKQLQSDGSTFKTIVIFSTSIKKALCEALMCTKKGYVYFRKREGTALKLYRTINGKSELIAAEQIFFDRK